MTTKPKLVGLGTMLVAYLVLIPLVFRDSPYVIGVLTNVSMLAAIASGVWLVFAIGRINIAQGGFVMIGGYATAILATRYGVPFWICLPLSGLIAAAVGALIGWPILRLKGVYFAMLTLSLTEAIRLAFLSGGDFTRGASGIVNIPRPAGFEGADPLPFYYLAAVLLILTLLALWRIANSRLGWIFEAMRLNEDLASSIGVNVAKYRVIAFSVCCFIAGIGGSFFAVFHQNIYPASYTVSDSINFMLYCFLGGLDYVLGPLVGTILLVVSFQVLQPLQQYQPLIYAVLMIAAMLWLPNGILSVRFASKGRAPQAAIVEPSRAAQSAPASAPSAAQRKSK